MEIFECNRNDDEKGECVCVCVCVCVRERERERERERPGRVKSRIELER